jgi:hypothetical protein
VITSKGDHKLQYTPILLLGTVPKKGEEVHLHIPIHAVEAQVMTGIPIHAAEAQVMTGIPIHAVEAQVTTSTAKKNQGEATVTIETDNTIVRGQGTEVDQETNRETQIDFKRVLPIEPIAISF